MIIQKFDSFCKRMKPNMEKILHFFFMSNMVRIIGITQERPLYTKVLTYLPHLKTLSLRREYNTVMSCMVHAYFMLPKLYSGNPIQLHVINEWYTDLNIIYGIMAQRHFR